jgi:D-amino-acid oxidase
MEVTVVAEKFAPQVTSVVAGALWEWPPAVCGHHRDNNLLARSKVWCKRSYEIFEDLAKDPETGVFMRKVTFYFRQPLESSPPHLQKMTELSENVRDFVRDPALIQANGVNPASGVTDAYSHLSPAVDTDVYMKWLLQQVRESGCEIVQQRISGLLREQEKTLKKQFRVELIINCSGLGSGELAGEAMYPLRGALVRVRNDGKRFPRVIQAHCVAHDSNANEPGFIFIVPRGADMLILGGLAEPDQWSLDIGLHNYEPVRTMFRRCVDFLPILENAEIDATEPVRVGLRPFRKENVRLDQEAGSTIIHNFGHGGAGVTFSWGCALEVAEMARRALVGEVVPPYCTR